MDTQGKTNRRWHIRGAGQSRKDVNGMEAHLAMEVSTLNAYSQSSAGCPSSTAGALDAP